MPDDSDFRRSADEIGLFWQEALALPYPATRGDRFFEVGGDSKAAVHVMLRIEGHFGIDFPMTHFFKNPSVEEQVDDVFAAVTAAGKAQSRQTTLQRLMDNAASFLFRVEDPVGSVVELKSGGDRNPIFFVPGGFASGNELMVFAALAEHLGGTRSLYGFQAPLHRWFAGQSTDIDVREMAAFYIAEMKRIQARGPYVICGECIAGVIAYEMAVQLKGGRADGSKLILLDAKHPTPCDLPFPTESAEEWMLGQHREELVRVVVPYFKALHEYRPPEYDGEVHVIATEPSIEESDPTLGWSGKLIGSHSVHRVPGDHDSYIREHGEHVAQVLRELLDASEVD